MTEPCAIAVVDLAFGDCGKGGVVDFLVRREGAGVVVRFNGGPQAGHNVVTADGRHHTFSQVGAGAFVAGVRTLLSRFMLIEPYAMLNEAAHLEQIGVRGPLDRVMIDRRAAVITPAQQAANRLRELARGAGAHGTCGMGVGELMQDRLGYPELIIYAGEIGDGAAVRRKLRGIGELKREQLGGVMAEVRGDARGRAAMEVLEDDSWIEAAVENYAHLAGVVRVVDEEEVGAILRGTERVVFEGAQGVLLDEDFGFHPHTTWSRTTFANVDALLDEAGFAGRRRRVGVLRSYFTRHGAGPLVSENVELRRKLEEEHNGEEGWQGKFRAGVFDAVAARYAIRAAGGVDGVALTHLDRIDRLPGMICGAYEAEGPGDEELFEMEGGRVVEMVVGRRGDLARQERMTGWLGKCRAVYSPVDASSEERFVGGIEAVLGVGVVIRSRGAGSGEKEVCGEGW